MHCEINYNSALPTQTTFPKDLGQRLTPNDINKRFVRIHPRKFIKSMDDWSYVPDLHNLEEIKKASCTFLNIFPNGDFQFIKKESYFPYRFILITFDAKDNDGLWARAEKVAEFVTKEEKEKGGKNFIREDKKRTTEPSFSTFSSSKNSKRSFHKSSNLQSTLLN